MAGTNAPGTRGITTTPATPLAPGDLIFVYTGPGLVTRLEGSALSVIEMMFGDGPEATRERRVAVFRDADGNLDISRYVSPLAAVEASWHLVNPAGDIVHGGPRGEEPCRTPDELEADRASGRYTFLQGAVTVHGIPTTAQRSPSADADWVHEAPSEAGFSAARGGMYRWYEPDSGQLATPGEPAPATDTPDRSVATGPYAQALAAATKAGARHADDAGLMALFCAADLEILVGAVSPQLVWEGAQRAGLSAADLVSLCAEDVMAVDELQWTTA